MASNPAITPTRHSATTPEGPAPSVRSRPSPVRERILDTATRLFYYQGIPATGIDNVIASAGVAKMSLYRHFGSKEQLIVECLERLDVRYHDWFVAQIEDREGDPVSKLLSVFDVLDEWFASDHFRGCAFINATVELANPEHPARVPAMRHKERNREYVEQLARGAGIADSTGLSKQLMLLVEGAIVTALVQDDLAAAANAKAAATALVDRALAAQVDHRA